MAGHRQATVTFRAVVGFGRSRRHVQDVPVPTPTSYGSDRRGGSLALTISSSSDADETKKQIKRCKIVFNWYSWPAVAACYSWSNRGLYRYKNQYRRSLPVNEYYVHSLLDVLGRDTDGTWSRSATKRVVSDVISRMSRCE
eukprot:scaffold201421_cov73-Attheya_sp.AAC.1